MPSLSGSDSGRRGVKSGRVPIDLLQKVSEGDRPSPDDYPGLSGRDEH